MPPKGYVMPWDDLPLVQPSQDPSPLPAPSSPPFTPYSFEVELPELPELANNKSEEVDAYSMLADRDMVLN